MSKRLKATITRIRTKPKAKTHDVVLIKFSLTNASKQDVAVLTWNTPLDRVTTDCLDVEVDGKAIEYDGPMVKRGAPMASDYVTLAPGQTVEAEFAVSNAYDTSKPGAYEIRLKRGIGDVFAERTASKAATTLALGKRSAAHERVSARTRFTIEKGLGGHFTLGEAARQQERFARTAMEAVARRKMKLRKKKSPKGAPRSALYFGGTSEQQEAARTAHSDGYKLASIALAAVANDQHYLEWFGPHTATRFARVKATLEAVKLDMETEEFIYNLTGSGCNPGVYAYTYKGTNTIWLCDGFWHAPTQGADSKAGTILHEHSHSDASTDDVRYGQMACRQLAKENPDAAVGNADTYEYYAGG